MYVGLKGHVKIKEYFRDHIGLVDQETHIRHLGDTRYSAVLFPPF
jgi:hypothetical protein